VSFADDEPRFLIVRDKNNQEWTFVTGGCKKRELTNPLICAIRELYEETKGVITINDGNYSYYSFKANYSKYRFTYHVYIIEVEYSTELQQQYASLYQMQRLVPTHPQMRCYNETDGLMWVTLSEFDNLTTWTVVQKNVIDSPEFLTLITSPNRKKFNLSLHYNYAK